MSNKPSVASLIGDLILVLLTGGLWILVLLIYMMRKNMGEDPGFGTKVLDLLLGILTIGIWWIWMLIKWIRSKS